MYTLSAYYRNSRIDFKDRKHPLFIGSCGTYRLYTIKKLPTHRPRGRLDWQILYVAAGRAHFFFNGTEHVIEAGNMVIYRPKEEQKYYYLGKDQTEVYWVHFTGSNVKNILRRYGITDDTRVIYTGISMEYKTLFLAMIKELNLTKPDYEQMLVNYFTILLVDLHRLTLQKPQKRRHLNMDEMDKAAQYFQLNYNRPISIEEYAASHDMSVGWFIKSFRQYAGTTPTQYIHSLRIANARMLLEKTDYNITEISGLSGFDDPLYFSRFFRKQCGMSPSQYRRQLSSQPQNDKGNAD